MFMFNSRNLLVGLVAASVSFGVGNWSGAIAQNAKKSERHVSDQEIQSLDQNFQSSIREFRADDRTQKILTSRTNQLNDFVNAWQKVDPSIAPYLGSWATIEGRTLEGSTMIYPSQTKGKVCVVMIDYFGRRFNLGTVVGNKLLVTGEIGKSVIIKKRSTLQSGIEVNSLALFNVFDGRVGVWGHIYPGKLSEITDSRLSDFGCTTSLPSNTQSRISRQIHPARSVVSDFYTWYLNNSRYRDILYQKKESFTPELYRYLDRAIRITQANNRWSGMLNYDLFSFTQVGSYSFQVTSVVTKNDSAEVYLNLEVGLRRSRSLQPIKVIVIKNGARWQIANFFYLKDPAKNYNLLSELVKFNQIQEFQSVP